MHRYWFEFDYSRRDPPIGATMGCGVTARSLGEARAMLRDELFGGEELPPEIRVIHDVDVSTLEANHVRPNMGNPVAPGIWFPNLQHQ